MKGIDCIFSDHIFGLNETYGRIMLINLLSRKIPNEAKLLEELESLIFGSSNDNMRYKFFDFYDFCPNPNDLTNIFKFINDFDKLRKNFQYNWINIGIDTQTHEEYKSNHRAEDYFFVDSEKRQIASRPAKARKCGNNPNMPDHFTIDKEYFEDNCKNNKQKGIFRVICGDTIDRAGLFEMIDGWCFLVTI